MLNITQTPTIKASDIQKQLNLDFFKDFEFGTHYDATVYILDCSDEGMDKAIDDMEFYDYDNNKFYYRLAQNHFALLNLLRAYGYNSHVFILTCE